MANSLIPHPEVLVPINENRCNILIRNCRGVSEEGEECDYHYHSVEEVACPECGTPRKRCANYPSVKGNNGRCRFHGGVVLSGIQHPNYQGKGWSRSLPVRMLEQYELTINDPNLLDFSPGISLLEARKADLMSRVDKDAAYLTWQKLRESYGRFAKARRSGNKTGQAEIMAEALSEIEDLILRGNSEALLWREILDIEERARKLRISELKRRESAATIITADQFKTLISYILNSINSRVKDVDLKMGLISDITSLQF